MTGREGKEAAEPEFGREQYMKLAIDLGPLAVFLVVWLARDIKWATGAIMAASLIAMIVSSRLLGRISTALIVTTALIVAFGGLTLLLDDPRFIQMKPTIVYLLFAAALGLGHILRRPMLKLLLGEALRLTDEGWRQLSLRWAGFFLVMAILNEIVRHFFSEAVWVGFKVGGFPLLTVVFLVMQSPLLTRHQPPSGST